MTVTDVFIKNFEATVGNQRFIINQGGTSSSKTFSILQVLILLAHKKTLIISIIAETIPHLKRGAMRDFYKILREMNLYNVAQHNRTDNSYKIGDSLIEFFSGDNIEKMKDSRRDILFCNEAYGITYDVFDQLEVRTDWLVFIDYNPVAEFWAHTLMEDFEDDCVFIHSTYKNNPFLSKRIIDSIERHKDNDYWWRVYGMGEIGVQEGLVFPFFNLVDKFPEGLPYEYGMDFGYTNSPTACIKSGIDYEIETIYWDEKFYETGMKYSDIIDKYRRMHFQADKTTIADSEDPRLIAELNQSEFNFQGAYKTKVKDELEVIKRYKIVVTKNSHNLIKELRNYMYKVDKKTGKFTNEPVDSFNHAIDAGRYAIMTKIRPTSGNNIFEMSAIH